MCNRDSCAGRQGWTTDAGAEVVPVPPGTLGPHAAALTASAVCSQEAYPTEECFGSMDNQLCIHTSADNDARQSPSPAPRLSRCLSGHMLAGLEEAGRQRSMTPVDDEHAAAGREHSAPITPAAATSQAPSTPAAGTGPDAFACARAVCPADAMPAPDAAAAAEEAAQRAASAAAVWRRIESFMRCVGGSPVVQSALLSLELEGSHPALHDDVPADRALHWTLAQLLAMHIKADCEEATQTHVLASLWLLESHESSWRSPATVCLNDYLKHLAVISQQAVRELTADWLYNFRALRQAMVDAQADMLKRLDWRLRLDPVAEIKPCQDLLFHLAADPAMAVAAAADANLSPARARQLWAARMHELCAAVQRHARLLRAPRHPAELNGDAAMASPSKRQRV